MDYFYHNPKWTVRQKFRLTCYILFMPTAMLTHDHVTDIPCVVFSLWGQETLEANCPASIATLAQRQLLRWANVGSPTLGQRGFVNWPNVGPTVARQRWPNVVPTSAQRWHTNVGPTLAQRYANGCMPTLYQHWPNGGCVTGFLWGEPIGHRSVTGWTNSRVE